MEYEQEDAGRYGDEPRHDRDRSASPRGARRDDNYRGDRERGGSERRNDSRGPAQNDRGGDNRDGDESVNPGTNLFVTGIAPRLNEEDITRMFSKYGEVKHCAIMKDPHTAESRGFGFVEMTTSEEAEAAKDGLSGENFEGRTLSIEKARRARPRTPTPGKYFGPPKRDDGRGFRDDRSRGYGGRDYRRDDRGYERRGGDRYDDRSRGYAGRDYRRDDRGYERRGGDRYDDRRRDRDRGDRDRSRYD